MTDELPFLQAIRHRPRSDEYRLIYADWLEERGDPRGRFVRAQCRAARLAPNCPARLELEAEAHSLLFRHEQEWLGPLAGQVSNWEFRRGLLAWVAVEATTFLAHAAEWLPALPLLGVYLRKARGHVAALADCPQLAFLNALYLGDNNLEDSDLAALLRSPHLRRLCELGLQSNKLSADGARQLASCPNLPRLRDLNLGAMHLRDDGFRALASADGLRRLRRLNLTMSFPTAAGIEVLARSPLLGRLRTLVLMSNLLPAGCLKTLAESPQFANLRDLGYQMNEAGDADVAALAASPHAANLTYLGLSANRSLTNASLAALAASPHLGRLRQLDFGSCRYGRAGLEALGRSRTLKSLRYLSLEEGEQRTGGQTIAPLLRSRLVRRLSELRLGFDPVGSVGLRALAAHRTPLRLRALTLAVGKARVAECAAVFGGGTLARLTKLTLGDVPTTCLGAIRVRGRLPELRELRLFGIPTSGPAVRKLVESPLVTQLRRLTLGPAWDARDGPLLTWLAPRLSGSALQHLELCWSLSPEQLAVLTTGRGWGEITQLKIDVFRIGASGARLLAVWPVLSQLRWLILSNSSSQLVPGLEALAESPHVGPLLRVDIHNGGVSKEAGRLIRGRFGMRFSEHGASYRQSFTSAVWATFSATRSEIAWLPLAADRRTCYHYRIAAPRNYP